jgi:hypothetical protein
MMITGGVYHALGGIAALFNDKVYVGIHLALATCARDA